MTTFTSLLLWSTPASAVPINQTYDFTVTDFVAVGPDDPLPFTAITGTFSVSFDSTSGQILNQPFSMDAVSFDFGLTAISYNVAHPGRAHIGGVVSGIGSLTTGANDFFLQASLINPLDPQIDAFIFTLGSSPEGVWFANTRTIAPAAVPEPATLALLGLGLAGLGFSRWNKKARLIQSSALI